MIFMKVFVKYLFYAFLHLSFSFVIGQDAIVQKDSIDPICKERGHIRIGGVSTTLMACPEKII
jgi:hypothetical protein